MTRKHRGNDNAPDDGSAHPAFPLSEADCAALRDEFARLRDAYEQLTDELALERQRRILFHTAVDQIASIANRAMAHPRAKG